jgi:predicted 3-demethylubiquinone-9 3-methyltransferase (glyoxalase superfamily)
MFKTNPMEDVMSLKPNTLTTCLWFDDQAEEAMAFYASIFPNSKVGKVTRYVSEAPSGKKKGDVMVATATLFGLEFVGLNGGPIFKQSEAASWQIPCQDQAEIDRYWDALLAGGGQPGPCGWLKDRFGVSWQVTPVRLTQLLEDSDETTAQRVTAAFMAMGKLDLAAIEKAAAG